MSAKALVWLRRDLRLADHPALCAAAVRLPATVSGPGGGTHCGARPTPRRRRATRSSTALTTFAPADEDKIGYIICTYFNRLGEHRPESPLLRFHII